MVVHPSLDIGVHCAHGAVRVRVDGEVDSATAVDLHEVVLSGLADAGLGLLVLDLSRARFFSSAGLSVLIALRNHLAGRGGNLVIVAGEGSVVFRVLARTGLDAVFTLTG